jgi:chromate reductase
MPSYNLLALSGSLRKGSYNTALLRAFKERAPAGVTIEFLEIGNLPLFNQDNESNFPQGATDLKNKIRNADGIIIATPEYNRSIPGVLKNTLDWTSRPYGDSAWNEKPVFVVGAAGGGIAAALAQYHLKQILLYLNAHVPGQPEFYCGNASSKFDAAGNLTDEATQKHIDSAFTTFIAFIDKLR